MVPVVRGGGGEMSRFPPSVPDRGDVVEVRMRNSGRRAALVLSPAAYTAATGLVVVCPVARESKGYPFEVLLPSRHLAGSVVLADRITSVEVDGCGTTLACRVPADTIRSVQEKLLPLLVANPQRILAASVGETLPEEMEVR
jgi:mRNA interferase MazF